ncbi:MAG: hypothetical protein ACFFDN_28325 [Candidatus Hodarchaeota archaeon]
MPLVQFFYEKSREFSLLLIPTTIFVIFVIIFPSSPAEDAYITFRYARNIANGKGYVWNSGENPIWGSTSILWTLTLAIPVMFGFDIILIAQILGVLIGLLIIISSYFIMVYPLRLSKAIAVFSCLLLATGSQVVHSMTGFDNLLFTLFMITSFGMMCYITFEERPIGKGESILCLNCLALSLTRPEGLIVSFFLLITLCIVKKGELKHIITRLSLLFVFPIILSYLAFWIYFGYPLPNTFFIKKGNELIYHRSITTAITYYLYGEIGLLVIVSALWLTQCQKLEFDKFLILVIPSFTYIVAYFFISQSQNIVNRFQYPIVPIIVIFFANSINYFFADKLKQITDHKNNGNIINTIKSDSFPHLLFIIFLLILFIVSSIYSTISIAPYSEGDDKALVGKVLFSYSKKSYKIVVSEAGMLPFFSDWIVMDAGGLNDEKIAHNGLSEEYIGEFNPEIVSFHNYEEQYSINWKNGNPWLKMNYLLYNYAIERNYTLACIIKSFVQKGIKTEDNGYQWYFIKPNFLDSQEILIKINNISGVSYFFNGGVFN